jgi:2-iminobutanoate/2-iminopropanoate deaminase
MALNFSPARRVGDLVFVSGQASVDDHGTIQPGTFAEEMARAIQNVRRALAEHGLDLSSVVKVGAYLRNADDLAEYNRLYLTYFSAPLPARTTIVNCLPIEIKFEMDVVAQATPTPGPPGRD